MTKEELDKRTAEAAKKMQEKFEQNLRDGKGMFKITKEEKNENKSNQTPKNG